MRIHRIQLEQYRSYPRLDLALPSGNLHLLLGRNGAGKTNILEALSVLSEGESFLGRGEEELVTWDENYYRIRVETVSDAGEEMTLEAVSERVPRTRRAFFVRDVRVPAKEFCGTLPTIVFLPQDLDLFTGPPAARRRLLDRALQQVSPQYRTALDTYQKTLKQRSALLRHIADGTAKIADLAVWNGVLAKEGAKITMRRLELLGVLQCTLAEELERLGEHWDRPILQYERTGEALTEEEIEREILSELDRVIERDILLQATSIGPHRDDWGLIISQRSLPSFASRGQQRTAVLALLFLLGSYLELQRGEKPVVLLDDVFSELDLAHQQALLTAFGDHQVFITATHQPEGLQDAVVWEVTEGAVDVQSPVALS
ncbi:MAG: DNA replication and repair protein RecF [Candidatus Peregrinibacteria bacterium Greene0416_62]|nr:MAG: DNA replication and repair protein RecF [Candidatus Peregrinibacteria bacterium Greene0416_62]TSC99792.1 MAG: DNA replication and repair protein RecF [Candidatus Peregrinibacteria bacterium Greene1014_49]